MRRKKEISPELKVARAKRILIIFALMGIVCLMAMCMRGCQTEEEPEQVEDVMDAKLDSLFSANGLSEAVLTESEQVIFRRYIPHCIEEEELDGLEVMVQLGELKDKELSDTMQRIEELKQFIKEYYSDKSNETAYYNRRIRFVHAGKEYTCIQVIDSNLIDSRLKHIMQSSKEDIKKLHKKLETLNEEQK